MNARGMRDAWQQLKHKDPGWNLNLLLCCRAGCHIETTVSPLPHRARLSAWGVWETFFLKSGKKISRESEAPHTMGRRCVLLTKGMEWNGMGYLAIKPTAWYASFLLLLPPYVCTKLPVPDILVWDPFFGDHFNLCQLLLSYLPPPILSPHNHFFGRFLFVLASLTKTTMWTFLALLFKDRPVL